MIISLKKNIFYFLLFIILFIHQIIFLKFFPNNLNLLGHDYEYFIPNFIFGKIWYKNNFLNIPWFSPSFCCGTPFFADPQTMFYSVQQILFIIFSPLIALKLMFFYFSFIAYFGMFLLLRKCFNVDKFISILGAALFLFNGFFNYRAIVGHVAYLGFVFVPLFCFFLIRSGQVTNKFLARIFLLFSSLIFASFFHGGAIPFLPIIVASIIFIIFFYYLRHDDKLIIKNLLLSLLIGSLIALSKITATLYFLDQFNREYPFLQFNGSLDYLRLAFNSLFLYPNIDLFNQLAVNKVTGRLNVHEIEFGVSVVPLIVFFLWTTQFKKIILEKKIFYFFILFIFFLPLLFNVDYYIISDVISKIPLLKSTWVQIRWTTFYIIPLIFMTVFILDKNIFFKSKYLFFFLLIILIAQNIFYNKTYYNNQKYNPTSMTNLFNKINYNKSIINIKGSALLADENNNLVLTNRNDFFSENYSSFFCYQPIFGYGLESFPNKKLILDEKFRIPINQSYNVKLNLLFGRFDLINKQFDKGYNFLNPSCFLFPNENNCKPGDLFAFNQIEDLNKFVNYKKFDFKQSAIQMASNYLSLISFILVFIFLIINSYFFYKKISNKN